MTTTDTTAPEETIRENLAALSERIRNQPNMTGEAKRRQLAQLHMQAIAAMTTLQADTEAQHAIAVKKATRAAFGTKDLVSAYPPSTPAEKVVIERSHREALDRVSPITEPRELDALLTQAEDTGDELLARAVGRQAYQIGDNNLLNRFVQTRPNQGRALKELSGLSPGTPSIVEILRYVVPSAPELGNLGDYEIGRLAETDMAGS